MTTQETLVLDCRGLRCPLPVVHLGRRIGEVPVGEVIAVVADDPAARPDVEAWCRMRGHEYVGQRPERDGVPAYLIRRMVC